MNPAGIPVFYGAFSDDVCIAEVRPHVGGLVVVGEFRTTRRLRLLDLTQLDEAGFAGSMFGSDYKERVMKRRFLRAFHYLISRPVQPHEEAIEYLPTQAVAEYISNVLGLDGIVYESAQLGAKDADDESSDGPRDRTKQNIALFNQAALVRGSMPRQTRSERTTDLLYDGGEPLAGFENQRRPSLRFVRGSEKVVRVTSIVLSHEQEYIYSDMGSNATRRRRNDVL